MYTAPGRRREGINDSKKFYEWIDRAGEDLEAAKLLINSDDTLNAAAFHCQQCIEKALKGYILFKTRSHVDGHNLTWLCRQAMKNDQRFTEWLDESTALNRYYIETRYPSDIPFGLTREMVDSVYNMAVKMYKFICQEIEKG
jgi:HEPN domain-containing protein